MNDENLTNLMALEMVMAIVQGKYTMSDFTNEETKELYCKLVEMKREELHRQTTIINTNY